MSYITLVVWVPVLAIVVTPVSEISSMVTNGQARHLVKRDAALYF